MKRVALTFAAIALLVFAGLMALRFLPSESAPLRESSQVAQPLSDPQHMTGTEDPMVPLPAMFSEPASLEHPVVSQDLDDTGAMPEMPQEGHVRCLVTDEQDNPIAEALVTVGNALTGYGTILAHGQTDFEGRCEITLRDWDWTALQNLTAWVAAEAPGYARAYLTQRNVQRNREMDFHFTLTAGGSLSGIVRWESGSPVPNADLLLHHSSSDMQGALATGRTDGEGRFRIDGLAPGHVIVTVSPNDGPYQQGGRFEVGQSDVEVIIKPRRGVVTGRVIAGCTRSPLSGVRVWLGDNISGYDACAAITDQDGHFRFDEIPLEAWEISTPDLPTRPVSIILNHLRPAADVQILAPERMEISGQLCESDTDAPVPGIGLHLVGVSWNDRPLGSEHAACTDDEGRFSVPQMLVAPIALNDQRGAWCPVRIRIDDPAWVFGAGHREFRADHVVGRSDDMRLLITRAFPFTVEARDTRGNPVDGVSLYLLREYGSLSELGVTDSEGICVGEHQRLWSEFQVIGRSEEWPLFLSPMIPPESTEAVTTAVPVTDLDVLVLDQDGQPVRNCSITAQLFEQALRPATESGGFIPVLRAQTDVHGRTTLGSLPRMQHFISAIGGRDSEGRSLGGDYVTLNLAAPNASDEVIFHLSPPEGRSLSGRVLGIAGSPIADADVHWQGVEDYEEGFDILHHSTRTNGEGDFLIRVPPSGRNWRLVAEAEGYTPSTVSISTNQTTVEIRLAPLVQIRGRVVGQNHQPVQYVPLTLWLPSDGAVDPEIPWRLSAFAAAWTDGWDVVDVTRVRTEMTDADGNFLWVPDDTPWNRLPAPAWIFAVSPDGEVATADFEFERDRSRVYDLSTLTLSPGIALEGSVVDESGQPIEGVSVHWEGGVYSSVGGLPPVTWQAMSDADGRFRLWPLPPGHWRVCFAKEGHIALTAEIDLTRTTSMTFTLPATRGVEVTVRVLDPYGLPAVDEDVGLMINLGLGRLFFNSQTDANGQCVFSNVPLGEHTLTCAPQGQGWHMSVQEAVTVGNDDVTCVIDPQSWPSITGHVSRDGAPLTGIQVEGWVGLLIGEVVPQHTMSVTSGAEGFYMLRLPPGQVTLHCEDYQQEFDHTDDIEIDIAFDQ